MIVPETATVFELVIGIVEAAAHPNCTKPPAESPAFSPASLQEYTVAAAAEGSASAKATSNALADIARVVRAAECKDPMEWHRVPRRYPILAPGHRGVLLPTVPEVVARLV